MERREFYYDFKHQIWHEVSHGKTCFNYTQLCTEFSSVLAWCHHLLRIMKWGFIFVHSGTLSQIQPQSFLATHDGRDKSLGACKSQAFVSLSCNEELIKLSLILNLIIQSQSFNYSLFDLKISIRNSFPFMKTLFTILSYWSDNWHLNLTEYQIRFC